MSSNCTGTVIFNAPRSRAWHVNALESSSRSEREVESGVVNDIKTAATLKSDADGWAHSKRRCQPAVKAPCKRVLSANWKEAPCRLAFRKGCKGNPLP
eukprot:1147118-Pleurochrysis_carterae.AAC.1